MSASGVQLTEPEKKVLMAGLLEWFGPARPTDALAAAMRFNDVADLIAQAKRIRALLGENVPMSALDWTRALAATEVAFVSDVFGSGCDWSITTGLSDAETIPILRGLQRKLVKLYAPIAGLTRRIDALD